MIDKIIELSLLSGGLLPLMFFLLLITIAVVIERLYFYHHVLKSAMSIEHDLQLVGYKEISRLKELANFYKKSLQKSIILSAISSKADSAESAERHMEEAILWQQPKLDKHLWVLDTSVTLAPLMGLLGTIIGMVHAFDILGVSGAGGATTQMVSGGIAEALVATGAGLFIAIIAVVALNHFNKRAKKYMHQMDLMKHMLINRLHGGGSETQGSKVSDIY